MVERNGQPLSVGRKTRTVPAAMRRALQARDGGCRFPGCTARQRIDGHHIQHWARGGRTELSNLVQLCRYHHRLVHEGGFGVERRGDSLVFTTPQGRPIPRNPRLRGGNCDELLRENVTAGIAIAADSCFSTGAGDIYDLRMAVDAVSRLRAPPRASPQAA
jgi:hypothetical protein